MEQPPNPNGQQPDPFAPQPPQAPPQQPQQANPYAAPQAQGNVPVNTQAGIPLTTTAFMSVLGTQIWVKIVSIVFLVLSGLQLVNIFITGTKTARVLPSGSTKLLLVYLIPLAFIVVYIIMALRLFQYGGAIGKLRASKNPGDFEKAMEMQTKFWRLLGIFCIIMIALFLIGMIMSAAAVSRF